MPRKSKADIELEHGPLWLGWEMIVAGMTIILMVSFVPAVGPLEREGYLFASGLALVIGGWMLGARSASRV